MCMYVNMYTCVHYYRLMIKYPQLKLQENIYIDLWLHSHQQNKQPNKQKKVFTEVGGGT